MHEKQMENYVNELQLIPVAYRAAKAIDYKYK